MSLGSDMDVKTIPSVIWANIPPVIRSPSEFLFLFIDGHDIASSRALCALPPLSPPVPCVYVPASFCMPHGLAPRVCVESEGTRTTDGDNLT